jgi:hypothetical protein
MYEFVEGMTEKITRITVNIKLRRNEFIRRIILIYLLLMFNYL